MPHSRFNEAGVRDAGDPAPRCTERGRGTGFNEAGVRDAGDLARRHGVGRHRDASTRPACETPEIRAEDAPESALVDASTRPACETPEIFGSGERLSPSRQASTRPACETPEIFHPRHAEARARPASTRPACETPEIPDIGTNTVSGLLSLQRGRRARRRRSVPVRPLREALESLQRGRRARRRRSS